MINDEEMLRKLKQKKNDFSARLSELDELLSNSVFNDETRQVMIKTRDAMDELCNRLNRLYWHLHNDLESASRFRKDFAAAWCVSNILEDESPRKNGGKG